MSTIWSNYIQTADQLYASRTLRFRDEYADDYKRALGLNGCGDILEIGCGPGALCAALGRWYPNACITGMDRDESFLAYAAERNPSVRFMQGDATALPFADDSFDATTSHTVQEHVETSAFLAEQRRVLRPGGVLTLMSSRTKLAMMAGCFFDFPDSVQSIIERAQPALNRANKEYQVCLYPLGERELLLAVERAGFCRASVGFVAVCNAPDSAREDAEISRAMIRSMREDAMENVRLIQSVASDLLTEDELRLWEDAIDDAYARRLSQLGSGERLWDINLSIIMIVRAVKPNV